MNDKYIKNISEEELRDLSFVDKAMKETFDMEAPPMPIFAEFTPRVQYLADEDLEDLMAAGQAALLDAAHMEIPKF